MFSKCAQFKLTNDRIDAKKGLYDRKKRLDKVLKSQGMYESGVAIEKMVSILGTEVIITTLKYQGPDHDDQSGVMK